MIEIFNLKNTSLDNAIDSILSPIYSKVRGVEVLLKPNILGAYPPEKAVTTHPDLIRTLYRKLKDMGAKPIVGDSPGGTVTDPNMAAKISGIYDACEGNFINLTGDIVEINLPKNPKIPKIWVSRKYLESPFVINIPKMKTHSLTIITGAIKNLYGIIPGNFKLRLHSEAPTLEEFSRLLADIYEIRPPDLNIMEAILAMEGEGPAHGQPKEVGLIISSENAVELDAITSQIMGIPPIRVAHLRIAHQRGLGDIEPAKITISGTILKIPSFKPPSALKSFLEKTLNRYARILTLTPELNFEKCSKCGDCTQNCPRNAIELLPYPKINSKLCISCFVCAETCPKGALIIPTVKKEMLNRIRRRILK